MRVIKEQVVCNLRMLRIAKGISQTELAARVGVKRQAVYDMETGRYVPNTSLALRISRELGCKVENLFVLDEPEDEKPVTLVEEACKANTRVSVARVGERLVAYPLDGKCLLREELQPADGFLSADASHVQLLHGFGQLDMKVLLLGCDPAFALLSSYASRYSSGARIHCRFASSHLALERLAAGYAHIAGTHLHNPLPSGESNVTFAQKILSGTRATIIAFSSFEEGLMVAAGNPHRIRTVVDLAREGITFVNREPGAALRILLDERLAMSGLTGESIRGYANQVSSHSLCAQMITFKMADVALGLRAIAAAYELDFVPMEAVRCDLVIPNDFLDLPAIKVLLDVLQTKSLRNELSSLPGYESACTGTVIGEVN